jgi:hypothetical protein
MKSRATELVERLGMQPHPESGWFVETYRAPLIVEGLPHGAPRSVSTAIYFLLSRDRPRTFLHRLRSDELYHLYEGGPLDVLLLFPDGRVDLPRLGLDIEGGERPQIVIPAGTWFGCELDARASHVLFGCTVAPGFEFADFELAQGPELARQFPSAAERIARMTRPG